MPRSVSLGRPGPHPYIGRNMKYTATSQFEHTRTARVGVLITNLGTPTAPDKKSVRAFLKEFLSDRRVVEIPRLLWLPILHGIILNTRPARSAAAYRSVWTEQGSPLLVHTRNQAQGLRELLKTRFGSEIVVEYAMRYGEPSLGTVLQAMAEQGVTRLVVLPLFPQYSCTTTASAFDAIAADLRQRRWIPELRFVGSYHDDPAYIDAVAQSIREHRAQHGSAAKLVFSYHGEPQRYVDQGDPYYCQCLKTTRLVAQALGLAEGDYVTTFQSRFGKAQWLQPYTDETLRALAAAAVDSVQVICPGFSADCLETLEEIAVENRDYFLNAGGSDYQYIPCLNSSDAHLDALATIAENHLAGWRQSAITTPAETAQLARARGARR